MQTQELSAPLPVHLGTPYPGAPHPSSSSQGELVEEPSIFDVVLGKASKHIAFLSKQWAVNMSSEYHFKLVFGSSYPIRSLWNHTALTVCSVTFPVTDWSADVTL